MAERVLTVDELKTYVDANWPKENGQAGPATQGEPASMLELEPRAWGGGSIRHLLARRLTRTGRWKEAHAYFSPELQAKAEAYVTAIRGGHDKTKTQAQQAESLWEAAKIARKDGLELLGTELEPDYAIWGGDFETGAMGKERSETAAKNSPLHGQTLNVAAAQERQRLQEQPPPEKRWHYRYVAAEHARAAALLMPDEDAYTAEVLCAPKEAEKFYRALVKRCGTTELGHMAAMQGWLPDLPEKKK